jgi:hypothetical protein
VNAFPIPVADRSMIPEFVAQATMFAVRRRGAVNAGIAAVAIFSPKSPTASRIW